MKVLCWRSEITGAEGRGNPLEDQLAEEWLEHANEQFKELEHWLENVEEP